ncbi:protein FAR-RED ELONGATED HYPOCOTYL 3-like [Pyrus ussuriensis x Pyrus communis]|uniref:Protein FAR-RED ELONGATED HYPOCOTYL 3-like n=1 Tax=Pyrus ussuriensis x Pyrus communis TaxID=2448454 RepID=A0A5N5G1M2_9ROSA|nr:protein FAR-RED ELONGATED HYPOCOTYL 3-like [Pyrus ussuriensis x Pyrus communis]
MSAYEYECYLSVNGRTKANGIELLLNGESSLAMVIMILNGTNAVNEKIRPLVGGTNENMEPPATKGDMECHAKRKSIVDDVGFLEPDPVKTKGSGKRFKKGKEKGKCKKRVNGNLCHGCGQYGINHDKRNCPKLHNQ